MIKPGTAAVNNPSADYPLANTQASRMFAEALERAADENGQSQRQLAKILNYKSSVVLSHMALGRVPIPIDRAMDFARLLKLDPEKFVLAVLEQRHPDIDFKRLFGVTSKQKSVAKGGRESFTLDELESIAGNALDDLPVDQINVMREVASDPKASRRWLTLSELQTIDLIRQSKPEGLTPAERSKLKQFLENV
jgi:hypothetical protein